MSHKQNPGQIVLGVGAVLWNEEAEVLLIRRSKPPRLGEWSLPGGKVEFGETLRAALLREVREETGLDVQIVDLLDTAEIIFDAEAGAADAHYVLVDFTVHAVSGRLAAGSDAADARWFSLDAIAGLHLWSETRRVIEQSADIHLTRR
ncbi:MAG TPA: NUDIX hydrolase [Beijerinckiaceae bacterium]|jgi:8-oxo-dGTP diphosphatase|nr:NUDIX hydrolase [Beijerinckiaceae bacterium]